MNKTLIVLFLSSLMTLIALALVTIIQRFFAVIAGSIITSVVLIRLSLAEKMSLGDLLSAGIAITSLGSFLLNVAYYFVWSYMGELQGARPILETLIMIVRSGVFFYMFVLDLIMSLTSTLAVISVVSLFYFGE